MLSALAANETNAGLSDKWETTPAPQKRIKVLLLVWKHSEANFEEHQFQKIYTLTPPTLAATDSVSVTPRGPSSVCGWDTKRDTKYWHTATNSLLTPHVVFHLSPSPIRDAIRRFKFRHQGKEPKLSAQTLRRRLTRQPPPPVRARVCIPASGA